MKEILHINITFLRIFTGPQKRKGAGHAESRRRKGVAVLLNEEEERMRSMILIWSCVSLLSCERSGTAVPTCPPLPHPSDSHTDRDSGTMFCWLLTFPLYLAALVTSTSIDEPPMELAGEPKSRMLHKSESFYVSTARDLIFYLLFFFCLA